MENFLIELEELDVMIDALMAQWAKCDLNSSIHLRIVLVNCQLVITMAQKMIEDYESHIDPPVLDQILEFARIVLIVKDEIYDKFVAVKTIH